MSKPRKSDDARVQEAVDNYLDENLQHIINKRAFWNMATNGQSDNWKSAVGKFVLYLALWVAGSLAFFYLISLLTIGTPLDGS